MAAALFRHRASLNALQGRLKLRTPVIVKRAGAVARIQIVPPVTKSGNAFQAGQTEFDDPPLYAVLLFLAVQIDCTAVDPFPRSDPEIAVVIMKIEAPGIAGVGMQCSDQNTIAVYEGHCVTEPWLNGKTAAGKGMLSGS